MHRTKEKLRQLERRKNSQHVCQSAWQGKVQREREEEVKVEHVARTKDRLSIVVPFMLLLFALLLLCTAACGRKL